MQTDFIESYDSLSPAIFRHIFFRISNRERALDLMQETFLKAWEYVQSGKEVKNLNALVYRIANNLIIDEYRRKKSLSLDDLQEQGFDVANNDQAEILKDFEITEVRSAVEKIPEKYREIVVLRFIDGLTPKEIAAITEQSENAVSVQINRSIKMLQKILHI